MREACFQLDSRPCRIATSSAKAGTKNNRTTRCALHDLGHLGFTSHQRELLRCVHCGREMMLWQVWHPRYGVVYDEVQAIKRGRYRPCRGSPPGAGVNEAGAKAMTQLALADLGV